MRLLLATLGSRGDVKPFLWLARAARHAGHDVRVATLDDPDLGHLSTRGGVQGRAPSASVSARR